jgi:hypothetical protein
MKAMFIVGILGLLPFGVSCLLARFLFRNRLEQENLASMFSAHITLQDGGSSGRALEVANAGRGSMRSLATRMCALSCVIGLAIAAFGSWLLPVLRLPPTWLLVASGIVGIVGVATLFRGTSKW